MSVIAEFHLSSLDIAAVTALTAAPDMSLHVEQAVAEDPEQPVIVAWGRGTDFETFETALAADETVAEFEVMESLCEERLYRFRISADAEVVFYPMDVEVGTSRLDIVATHEGLEMRMRFSDQTALREYFDRCREQGVSVSLQRLYHDQNGDDAGDAYSLSPKQRRTLERAYQRGFFDVPRSVSLADVAAELDVSEQAVSERLRRATATLIGNALDPDEGEYREQLQEAKSR